LKLLPPLGPLEILACDFLHELLERLLAGALHFLLLPPLIALLVHLWPRRVDPLRTVVLGPLFQLRRAGSLLPQLRVLLLVPARLLHLLPQPPTPVHTPLVNLVPLAREALKISGTDVDLAPVRLPCAHPDVDVGMIGVLMHHRRCSCIRKFLLQPLLGVL